MSESSAFHTVQTGAPSKHERSVSWAANPVVTVVPHTVINGPSKACVSRVANDLIAIQIGHAALSLGMIDIKALASSVNGFSKRSLLPSALIYAAEGHHSQQKSPTMQFE